MVSTGDPNAPPVEDFVDVYGESTGWIGSTLLGSTTLALFAAGAVGAITYWAITTGMAVLEVAGVAATAVFAVSFLSAALGRR